MQDISFAINLYILKGDRIMNDMTNTNSRTKNFMQTAKTVGKYAGPVVGPVVAGAGLVVGQTLAQLAVMRMSETPEQKMQRLQLKEYKRAMRAKKRAQRKNKVRAVKEVVVKPIDEFEKESDELIEQTK